MYFEKQNSTSFFLNQLDLRLECHFSFQHLRYERETLKSEPVTVSVVVPAVVIRGFYGARKQLLGFSNKEASGVDEFH